MRKKMKDAQCGQWNEYCSSTNGAGEMTWAEAEEILNFTCP